MLTFALAPLLVFSGPPRGAGITHQIYLEDKGQGQKCRLWIPDGEGPLRGILIDLGSAHGSDRADFQAFGSANRYAVLGTLLRWPREKNAVRDNVRAILADYARSTGHPELGNLPWILEGFSRSTGPNNTIAVQNPDTVLAVMAGGVSPGVESPEDVAASKRVPTMAIIGSEDPFAAGPAGVKTLDWFFKRYPGYRKKEIAWGAGITWGAGHTHKAAMVLQAAFLKDVMAQRLPVKWDPLSGPPVLKDMSPVDQGWLGDPRSWEGPYPTVAPHAKFEGDKEIAHWLPGPYTAAVWRAYVVKTPTLTLHPPEPGSKDFRVTNAPAGATISFFDGDKVIGKGSVLPASKLSGFQCVFAEAVADGVRFVSRPLLVLDGVSIPLGSETAAPSQEPLALLELSEAEKATARTLLARGNSSDPGTWAPAFSDAFDNGIGAWSVGKLPGTAEVVDGSLQIASSGQMVCALPYNWPRDLAVGFRCRTLPVDDQKPNDIGVMLGGIDGGDRPWRDGLLFHLGAEGQPTSWQVVGETDPDAGPHSSPSKWHRVRVERAKAVLRAWVDDVELPARTLKQDESRQVKGSRVGFYTVANRAQIDDVHIFTRVPSDLANAAIPAPTDAAVAGLARALLALRSHVYAEQRNLSADLLTALADALLPAIRPLDPSTLPEASRPLREALLQAAPPPLNPNGS